jgi:hypothetical protein
MRDTYVFFQCIYVCGMFVALWMFYKMHQVLVALYMAVYGFLSGFERKVIQNESETGFKEFH